jgi:beta-N-acetylhexosaminidase
LNSILHDVSRLFVWGFNGMKLTPSLKALLKRHSIAGVILFKRNIESVAQMRGLTRGLRSAGGRRLLIGIDEEGGRVSRLPAEALKFPPAALWGKIYEREGNLAFIEETGRLLGRELKSLGVNLDFAPVLDVNSNPENPIIGDRAFSHDPKIAAKVALAFATGLRREGVLVCGKHFPGHGDTATDSHLTLPRVRRDWKGLERIELTPFRIAISQRIPMLMTAHVVYDALDPKLPATLSPMILTELLRRRMRFKGVVISDDLNMKAISKKHGPEESAILALEAGVDLILICEGLEKIGAPVMEEVAREVSKSPILSGRVRASLKRIAHLGVGS